MGTPTCPPQLILDSPRLRREVRALTLRAPATNSEAQPLHSRLTISFSQKFSDSAAAVDTYLAELVTYMNVTYEAEINTRLLIGDVILYTSSNNPTRVVTRGLVSQR